MLFIVLYNWHTAFRLDSPPAWPWTFPHLWLARLMRYSLKSLGSGGGEGGGGGFSIRGLTPSSWRRGGGGEGGKAPSKLEKVGISSLPTHDTTRRLPDSGGGEGRRRGGRGTGGTGGWGPAGALASPGAGGETSARVVPWWSAARCRRWALARAPRWRQRRAGASQAVGRGEVGVVVEEGEDGDSNWSLVIDLPPLDRIVRETVSPATSSSSNRLKIFRSSGFIFSPDIWTWKEAAGAPKSTSSHFHYLSQSHKLTIRVLDSSIQIPTLLFPDLYLMSDIRAGFHPISPTYFQHISTKSKQTCFVSNNFQLWAILCYT